MTDHSYRLAGWVAVAACAVFLAETGAYFMLELPRYQGRVPFLLPAGLLFIHVLLSSYALLRLRSLLNERYEFSNGDLPIYALVLGGVAIALLRAIGDLVDGSELIAVPLLLAGLLTGVASIIFGYRLFAVNGTLGGFKKAFAVTHIAAPVCFATVVLAPLGLLLMLLAAGLLAAIFLTDDHAELEFV